MKPTVAIAPLLLAALAFASLPAGAAEPTDEVLRQTYTVTPGGKLQIEANQGSVTVVGADTTTATLEVTRKIKRATGEKADQLLRNHTVQFSQNGNTLRLESKVKRSMIPTWTWGGPGLEVEIKVTVPRRFDVEATTSGGSVRATDLEGTELLRTSGGSVQLDSLKGDIKASTSGGSIKGSQLSGKIDVATAGGSITLETVSGDNLKANTSGGSIKLAKLSVPVETRTAGGSITLETSATPVNASTSGGSINAIFTAAPKSDCLLKTSAGSINLSLPAAASFQLDASTTAGGVKSDFPVTVTSSSAGLHGNLQGPVNGGGPLLKLRTSAGSIRLKKS